MVAVLTLGGYCLLIVLENSNEDVRPSSKCDSALIISAHCTENEVFH